VTDAPRSETTDRTFALLRQGYRFTSGRRVGPVMSTRLLGRPAVVVGGRAGAELFYDESRLVREDAMPAPLMNSLFGEGAVHGLDDAAHRHRKQLFVSLLTDRAALEISEHAAARWTDVVHEVCGGEHLNLFDAAVRVHCAAVCEWAGVPAGRVNGQLARDLAALVDGFGSVGLRHVSARRARRRVNTWAERLIEQVRHGQLAPARDSALCAVAEFRDIDGAELPTSVAAVELINILRPTVAVAWFVSFSALALNDQPMLAERLRDADDATLEAFAHELRRLYPFVPLLGARARTDFDWNGVHVPRGRLVLLDVYGTLHDPELWHAPGEFELDRFTGIEPDPFTLVPQGGGDATTGHRCPGERVAIELIKTTVRLLTSLSYDLPPQDLRVRMGRMPTRPRSGVVIEHVRPRIPQPR